MEECEKNLKRVEEDIELEKKAMDVMQASKESTILQ